MIRYACSVSFLLAGIFLANVAGAIEYRSVGVPVAILYDSYSLYSTKLFLVKAGMPLEVVVEVEGWTKVHDAEGSIAWIENRALSPRRMVVVTAELADIRQSAAQNAPIVFQAEKWVALELLESGMTGWARVRHRDGVSGFVHITQIWGL